MIYNLLINACFGCPVCPFDSCHVCISLRPSELLYRIHYILLAFFRRFQDVCGVFFWQSNTLLSYNWLINACIGCPVCPFDCVPSVLAVPSVPSCFTLTVPTRCLWSLIRIVELYWQHGLQLTSVITSSFLTRSKLHSSLLNVLTNAVSVIVVAKRLCSPV